MDTKQKEVFDELHRLIEELMRNRQTPATESKVLHDRAQKLKQALVAEDTGEKSDLVVFQLAHECFALDTQFVYEVRGITDITPVPCTPDFVLGITNIRGMIYSVIDIRDAFGLDNQVVTDKSMLIVIHWKNLELCILVDAVHEKISLPKRDIKNMPIKEGTTNYLTGFFMSAERKVTILNWDAYVQQSNIIVNEEI